MAANIILLEECKDVSVGLLAHTENSEQAEKVRQVFSALDSDFKYIERELVQIGEILDGAVADVTHPVLFENTKSIEY